jgi:hypothetical protein
MKKAHALVFALVFLSVGAGFARLAETAEMPRGQKGVTTGIVTAKGQNWIEVLGESGTIKRYIPFGALPEDGRKYDAPVLKQIRQTRLNSRVVLNWQFQKYLRVVSIKEERP